MRSKHILPYIPFIALAFAGCVKTVPASTNDSDPPKVGLLVAAHGQLKSVEGNGTPEILTIRQDSEAAVIAGTSDPQGAKYVKLTIVSGGMFRDNNDNLVTEAMVENQIVEGKTRSGAFVGGTLVPDSPTSQIVIRAQGADWAGNEVTTPTITITQRPAPVARISASSTSIDQGSPVTITYETEHADEVTLNGTPQATLSGAKTFTPTTTTTYTLEARNQVGRDQSEVTVQVIPPPSAPRIDSFQASRSTLEQGQSVTISWSCANTTSVTLKRNGSTLLTTSDVSGSRSFTMSSIGTQTFTLTATGPGGTNTASLSVEVTAPPTPEPECMRTNCLGNLTCFRTLAQNNTGSLWQMDLTVFSSSGRITTIKNNLGLQIVLEVGNTQRTLSPGQRTSAFSNINLNTLYTALIAHPPALTPAAVDIEICYE